MRVLLLALLLNPAIAASLSAQREPITRTNVALAVSASVLLLIDRGMTEHALRHGRGEANPIIGPRPSVGQLNTYIAAVGVAQLAAGLLLHEAGARNFLWGTSTLLEVTAISWSVSLKIPIRF